MKKIALLALCLTASLNSYAEVFATVNGEDITEKDLLPVAIAAGLAEEDIKLLPKDAKNELINRAIEFKLILEEAEKEGITEDKLYKDQVEYAKKLSAVNIWQLRQVEKIKISESELKKFYEENKEKFTEPAKQKVKHILVEKEKDAQDIIDKLSKLKDKELEEKFSEIAKEKSIEPMAKETAGQLPEFPKGAMVKEFESAVFAMKKGELSAKPVKTEFGYHVILKQDEKAERKIPLDEVKEFIETNLKQQKTAETIKEAAQNMRKKAKVEYKNKADDKENKDKKEEVKEDKKDK